MRKWEPRSKFWQILNFQIPTVGLAGIILNHIWLELAIFEVRELLQISWVIADHVFFLELAIFEVRELLQVSWVIADHGFFLLLQMQQGVCLHLEEMDKTVDDVVFLKVHVEKTLASACQ